MPTCIDKSVLTKPSEKCMLCYGTDLLQKGQNMTAAGKHITIRLSKITTKISQLSFGQIGAIFICYNNSLSQFRSC